MTGSAGPAVSESCSMGTSPVPGVALAGMGSTAVPGPTWSVASRTVSVAPASGAPLTAIGALELRPTAVTSPLAPRSTRNVSASPGGAPKERTTSQRTTSRALSAWPRLVNSNAPSSPVATSLSASGRSTSGSTTPSLSTSR